MPNIAALVMLGGAALLQISAATAQSALIAPQPTTEAIGSTPNVRPPSSPSLGPPPKGKSTILGGEIRDVDPVRDQLTLKVYGQRQMKILFDERTQVYLDGKRIALGNLGPAGNASVQTVLDGTDVYALSIHMLSHSPEGEYRGHVLSYDKGTRELTLSAAISRQPIKLLVPVNAPVIREGQKPFIDQHPGESDLIKGALVSVEFVPGRQGAAVAHRVAILATPGSAFIFTGNIASLDIHSGSLILIDTKDDQSYQVSFDSAKLPEGRQMREGDRLKVTATFDGTRYVASEITVN